MFELFLFSVLDSHVTIGSQCPDVNENDQVEKMACGEGSCPIYDWEKGPWGTCVIHQPDSATGMYRPFIISSCGNQ